MKERLNIFKEFFNNSYVKYSVISIVTIFLIIVMGLQPNTISDLSFDEKSISKASGYSEPEGGVTYLEALGLQYLSLGSIFNYGVNSNVITYYYEGLMNENLVSDSESDLLGKVADIESNVTSEKYLALEDVATVEEGDYYNSNGEKIDGNTVLTITVPKTLAKENISSTSNAWKFTYHFYKDGLIGVDNAIWYSQLFENSEVFDRAWNSLKWLCQDKIQCEILADYGDEFLVLVYGNEWNWVVTLDRLTGDAFNSGDNINYIKMTVLPVDEENSLSILSKYGIVSQVD